MLRLLKATEKLLKVSPEAATAYDTRKGLLTERVNVALATQDNLSELIGRLDSTELMQDNHRNHSTDIPRTF